MHNPNDFHDAVQRNLAYMDNIEPKVLEYKEIMRRLDPQNPTLTNVERWRT